MNATSLLVNASAMKTVVDTVDEICSSIVTHEGKFYRHHYFLVTTEDPISSCESLLTPVSLDSAFRGRHFRAGFTTALTDALEVCHDVC